MFYSYKGKVPVAEPSAFVHPQAVVTGDVYIGNDVYIGPGAAIRGDFGSIIIEDGCNVQENCTIHMFPGITVVLQQNSHIGHGAIIHGATIGRNCLVGMNAVIMDEVVLGDECIVGALSFIKAGEKIPSRSLVAGNPAKIIKTVSDQMIDWKSKGTAIYQQLARDAHSELVACEPRRSKGNVQSSRVENEYKIWKKTEKPVTINNMDKLNFLLKKYTPLLGTIDPVTQALFGKMNVQQMIEHMTYSFQNASGIIALPALNDEETRAKMYRFMMSDKPFRDNTPNPNLPDEPDAARHTAIADSIAELQQSIEIFVQTFTAQPEKRILNPFFGNLNFEEWIHLLYKHAFHHLRQFGVTIN